MASFSLKVNGRTQAVEADPDCPLLYVLQEDLRLNGPKFGCGLAQCGACTVLMNGEPIRSCTTPMSEVTGEVTTIEGLGTQENLHPIQQAFVDEQAIQCGFCVSGVMLYGKVFMDKNPRASREEISRALDGILCRCAAHVRMVRALERYGREVKA